MPNCLAVACRSPQQPLISIADVLDTPHRAYATPQGRSLQLPFVNQNCRVRVRVVDFWPPALEDFARLVAEPEVVADSMLSQSQGFALGGTPPPTWEWEFALLVEDAGVLPPGQKPTQMSLVVSGKDAEYLLKLDATE